MGSRRSPLVALASGFGAGYAPIVPGTFGTLAAVPFAVAGLWLLTPLAFALAAIAFVPLAILAADAAVRAYGEKDPGRVVVDEWAGYFLTVALHPPDLWTIGLGFFVFRVLDVIKPPPARQLERLPGGAGVVLDDVAAGLYSHLALRLLRPLLGL